MDWHISFALLDLSISHSRRTRFMLRYLCSSIFTTNVTYLTYMSTDTGYSYDLLVIITNLHAPSISPILILATTCIHMDIHLLHTCMDVHRLISRYTRSNRLLQVVVGVTNVFMSGLFTPSAYSNKSNFLLVYAQSIIRSLSFHSHTPFTDNNRPQTQPKK